MTRDPRRRPNKVATIGALVVLVLLVLVLGFPRFAALADLEDASNATGCLVDWRFLTSVEKRRHLFVHQFHVELVGGRASVGEMMVSCGYLAQFPSGGTSREVHSISHGYSRMMRVSEVGGGQFRFTIKATSDWLGSASPGP